jgi:4-nitrophenyl phosphatase
MLCVLDLDGVVWLAGNPIDGSPEAVTRLRQAGVSVVFVTNNSSATLADYVGRLERAGVEVDPSELATSAQAAATLVHPGERVSVIGGPGLFEAVGSAGAQLVEPEENPDAVVAGRTVDLDFGRLSRACKALRGGARFVAANNDATFPTPDGLEPGAGALIAFLEVASGRRAEVAGKPNQAMAKLLRERHGVPDLVIGDSPRTDGGFAEALGAPFALVLSGVTSKKDLPVDPSPSIVAADAAEAVDVFLAGGH